MTALVVFAIGNDARGDDALGPMLFERIEAAAIDDVRAYAEYQLQIEHALDLRDAGAVLFIDAATDLDQAFAFRPLEALEGTPVLSHALGPEALLAVYRRVEGRPPPPAYVLAVRGVAFELGAPLSDIAAAALEAAWAWLQPRLSVAGLLAPPAAQYQQRKGTGDDAPEGGAHAQQ